MGPLTYKVFNLHLSKQFGTSYSHLPQQLEYVVYIIFTTVYIYILKLFYEMS
jgi:hypothetical protein